mgnify:CR=1 FL=1
MGGKRTLGSRPKADNQTAACNRTFRTAVTDGFRRDSLDSEIFRRANEPGEMPLQSARCLR